MGQASSLSSIPLTGGKLNRILFPPQGLGRRHIYGVYTINGIREDLRNLLGAASGAQGPQIRCMARPQLRAFRPFAHLGLADRFTTVVGDTLEGARGTKALVVGEALHRLGDPDPATVVMVGDRHHDVEGSRAHGVDCAGVLWGYGTSDELRSAGAWAICPTPADVAALLA